jgi:hypothetical protein
MNHEKVEANLIPKKKNDVAGEITLLQPTVSPTSKKEKYTGGPVNTVLYPTSAQPYLESQKYSVDEKKKKKKRKKKFLKLHEYVKICIFHYSPADKYLFFSKNNCHFRQKNCPSEPHYVAT